jgi:hypothetical protein
MMWEEVTDSCNENSTITYYEETERLKVPTGWIVKTVISYDTHENRENEDWDRRCISQVFVPDPEHAWEIE